MKSQQINIETKSELTKVVNKNIKISGVSKIAGLASNYLLITVIVNYISTEEYGVWLTMSSIFIWFSVIDVSFGNGLRNDLIKSLKSKNYLKAKKQISTLYAFIAIFAISVMILGGVMISEIKWSNIFKSNVEEYKLKEAMILLMLSIGFQTILKTCNAIFFAEQKSGFVTGLTSSINIIILIATLIIQIFVPGSLLIVCLIHSLIPVLIYSVLTIIVFTQKYKLLRPNITDVNFFECKNILSTGLIFFIIQITALLIFSSGNIVVSYFGGASEVASYGTCYRYFNVVIIGFSTIVSPYWSAFTAAINEKDFAWIHKSIERLKMNAILMAMCSLILLLLSPFVYKIWLNDKIQIRFTLSVLMAIYVISYVYLSIYNYYINSHGKIRLQLYISIIGVIIYGPALYFTINILKLGSEGVVIVGIIWNIILTYLWHKQTNKLLTGKAIGIWNK